MRLAMVWDNSKGLVYPLSGSWKYDEGMYKISGYLRITRYSRKRWGCAIVESPRQPTYAEVEALVRDVGWVEFQGCMAEVLLWDHWRSLGLES